MRKKLIYGIIVGVWPGITLLFGFLVVADSHQQQISGIFRHFSGIVFPEYLVDNRCRVDSCVVPLSEYVSTRLESGPESAFS